jgi:hypothetical protein
VSRAAAAQQPGARQVWDLSTAGRRSSLRLPLPALVRALPAAQRHRGESGLGGACAICLPIRRVPRSASASRSATRAWPSRTAAASGSKRASMSRTIPRPRANSRAGCSAIPVESTVAIFAALGDKDLTGIVAPRQPSSAAWIVVRSAHGLVASSPIRGSGSERWRDLASPDIAISKSRQGGAMTLPSRCRPRGRRGKVSILIFGSFFTVAAALALSAGWIGAHRVVRGGARGACRERRNRDRGISPRRDGLRVAPRLPRFTGTAHSTRRNGARISLYSAVSRFTISFPYGRRSTPTPGRRRRDHRARGDFRADAARLARRVARTQQVDLSIPPRSESGVETRRLPLDPGMTDPTPAAETEAMDTLRWQRRRRASAGTRYRWYAAVDLPRFLPQATCRPPPSRSQSSQPPAAAPPRLRNQRLHLPLPPVAAPVPAAGGRYLAQFGSYADRNNAARSGPRSRQGRRAGRHRDLEQRTSERSLHRVRSKALCHADRG